MGVLSGCPMRAKCTVCGALHNFDVSTHCHECWRQAVDAALVKVRAQPFLDDTPERNAAETCQCGERCVVSVNAERVTQAGEEARGAINPGGPDWEVNPWVTCERCLAAALVVSARWQACECGGTKAGTTHSHWCPVFGERYAAG